MTQTIEINIPPNSDALVILKLDKKFEFENKSIILKINSD